MKKIDQKGFSVIEVAIIIAIVALMTGVGYYVWHTSHAKTSKVASVTKQPHKTIPQPSTNPPGWDTFKSKVSSLTFRYPSGWKMVEQAKVSSPVLEEVSFYGTNNFIMNLVVDKDHTNTAASCALAHQQKPVALSINDLMVPEGSTATNSRYLYFEPASTYVNKSGMGCSLALSYISLGHNEEFVLSASYASGPASQGVSTSKLLAMPEVKTAEQLFTTVNY